MRALVIAIVVAAAACAPIVDGPTEAQRTRDRDDETALAAQLAAIPDVLSAHVTLHRPVADPLSLGPASAASAAILVVIAGGADRQRVLVESQTLAHAAAPEIPAPTIVVETGAPPAELADVGPFTVAKSSRGPLRATLAIALIAVAALALAVAYLRRGART